MSTEKPGRPVRPSTAREAAARAAAKLERGVPARLVVETAPEVLRELKLRAAERGVTVRAFVLGAIAEQGVHSAREDLER